MTTEKGIDISQSGLGLTLFTASAFLSRLTGDSLTMHIGPRRLLAFSLPIAFVGFLGILLIGGGPLLFASYVLIGIGCANTVPVFTPSWGRKKKCPSPMPSPQSVPSATSASSWHRPYWASSAVSSA